MLKPDTDPTDGIFVGGDADPLDFVGPDNAGYVGRTIEDTPHIKMALDAHHAPWALAFADNECE